MKNKQFIILAVVCVVTLLPFMGLTDFHTKGEPREAIVAYSMIETVTGRFPSTTAGTSPTSRPCFTGVLPPFPLLPGK